MNDTFLKACRGEPTDYTPIWMMRQAGRYLPEYQKVRRGRTFLELCKSPELCVEVTLQPIDILGFDAAILRIPIVNKVYGSVKQVTDFAFSEREIEFNRVVAIQYPREGIWSLGFVTGNSMREISEATGEPMLSVLMPTSPMPMTAHSFVARAWAAGEIQSPQVMPAVQSPLARCMTESSRPTR